MIFSLNSLNQAAHFFINIAGELAILFIGISFLVGLLQEFVPPEKIQKVLGDSSRASLLNNAFGAFFGALTPFCSCSTIPITLGLLNSGVNFGSAMSFLVASPLLNPVIITMMAAMLGLRITVVYFVVTFPAAVLIGYIWDKIGLVSEVKDVTIQRGCCCTEEGSGEDGTGKASRISKAFFNAWALFKHMLPWLIVGAGVGSFIYGFVPADFVVRAAGPGNPFAIPVAAAIGIPMYIRTETILPISKVLFAKGMGLGAIMALMIGGSGASIPEVSLLAAIFKKKLVIAFVGTIFILAVVSGYIFEIFI